VLSVPDAIPLTRLLVSAGDQQSEHDRHHVDEIGGHVDAREALHHRRPAPRLRRDDDGKWPEKQARQKRAATVSEVNRCEVAYPTRMPITQLSTRLERRRSTRHDVVPVKPRYLDTF
jgi:hypothetical protein